jgi:hypothetical protein
LRSWFGQIAPQRIPLDAGMIHPDLERYYRFEAYAIGAPIALQGIGMAHTVAVMGLPRGAGAPPIHGFAARATLADAKAAALRECLQRLSFLWGEPLPEEAPHFCASPDYHQEYFLTQEGSRRLLEWLEGGHQRFGQGEAPESVALQFLDITPKHLSPRLCVVKALSADCLALTFGANPDLGPKGFPEDRRIHPVM